MTYFYHTKSCLLKSNNAFRDQLRENSITGVTKWRNEVSLSAKGAILFLKKSEYSSTTFKVLLFRRNVRVSSDYI